MTGGPRDRAYPVLLAFGVFQLLLALFIVAAPATFAATLGAFGERNDHLARDVATIYLALGVGLIVAASRAGWRVPVLAVATVHYGAHAVNHLVDVGHSEPGWVGPVDLVALLFGVGLLVWQWRLAAKRREEITR